MSSTGDQAPLAVRLFQRGITAFKSEDYLHAIRFLDGALEALPSDATITLKVNMLDSRAAAKERIHDIRGSLADAKAVIDLAPDSPKGYIRAARLFQKIGRPSTAVKMFERAIIKLSADAKKNQAIIKALQGKLKQAQIDSQSCRNTVGSLSAPSASPKPKRDVSGFLPFEIFINILICLDSSSRFRCMAVCKSWRNTIWNTPHLWTELFLTSSKFPKIMDKLQFWLSRLGPHHCLQSLSIKLNALWPLSETENLFSILRKKSSCLPRARAGLRSFTFHFNNRTNSLIEVEKLRYLAAFLYLNRTTLVTLELFTSCTICSAPLHTLVGKFPRLKEFTLQAEGHQSLPLMLDGLVDTSQLDPVEPENPAKSEQPENPAKSELEVFHLRSTRFPPGTGASLKLLSLRSLSIIAINSSGIECINLASLNLLENLEICRLDITETQWDSFWGSCDCLPSLKRLSIEQFGHFIPHFLRLANIPDHWSPNVHAKQPFKLAAEDILPKLECLRFSLLDSVVCCKFLALFGYQFEHLKALSLVGVPIDARTEAMLICAFRDLPPLIHINLSQTNVTPEVIDVIKPDLLTHLELTHCTKVNFRSLTRLFTHEFDLLDIRGCVLISTHEMLEWLAKRVHSFLWQVGDTKNTKATKRLLLD